MLKTRAHAREGEPSRDEHRDHTAGSATVAERAGIVISPAVRGARGRHAAAVLIPHAHRGEHQVRDGRDDPGREWHRERRVERQAVHVADRSRDDQIVFGVRRQRAVRMEFCAQMIVVHQLQRTVNQFQSVEQLDGP